MRENRVSAGTRIANILTTMFILLALIIGAGFAYVFFFTDMLDSVNPPPPTVAIDLPTAVALAVIPTATDTPTPGVVSTFTPEPTNTRQAGPPTVTRRPTLTPSPTLTLPPATPTRTPTITPSPIPTEGPSPTPTNTLSPFPFTKSSDSPIYLQNFANGAGCNWLGIAGEVLDTGGNPVAPGNYRVHVFGDGGIDARLDTGSASAYSPSGWEQFIFNSPVIRTYNIQLETVSGTAVSQVYQVQTRSSCNQNLLYFIFTQNR